MDKDSIKDSLVKEAIELLQDPTTKRLGLAVLLLNTAREIILFEYSQERAELERQRLQNYLKKQS